MSIINDALRKPGSAPAPEPGQKPSRPPFDPQKFLIPVIFIACIGWGYHIMTKPHKAKATALSTSKNGRTALARSVPAPKNYSDANPVLEGVIYQEGAPLAIVNGKVVKQGQAMNDYTVESITPDGVILRDAQGQKKHLTF